MGEQLSCDPQVILYARMVFDRALMMRHAADSPEATQRRSRAFARRLKAANRLPLGIRHAAIEEAKAWYVEPYLHKHIGPYHTRQRRAEAYEWFKLTFNIFGLLFDQPGTGERVYDFKTILPAREVVLFLESLHAYDEYLRIQHPDIAYFSFEDWMVYPHYNADADPEEDAHGAGYPGILFLGGDEALYTLVMEEA